MQQLATVKEFMFNEAHYYVSDGHGDTVVLHVNYRDNDYSIESRGRVVNSLFRQELRQVVTDLLRRKHGVNFAQPH